MLRFGPSMASANAIARQDAHQPLPHGRRVWSQRRAGMPPSLAEVLGWRGFTDQLSRPPDLRAGRWCGRPRRAAHERRPASWWDCEDVPTSSASRLPWGLGAMTAAGFLGFSHEARLAGFPADPVSQNLQGLAKTKKTGTGRRRTARARDNVRCHRANASPPGWPPCITPLRFQFPEWVQMLCLVS